MGTATAVFLVLGGVGIVVLAASLIFGELLHLGHADADGLISVPVVAGFVGGLGFIGALGASLTGGTGTVSASVGMAAGLAGALPIAWFAAWFTRAVSGMRTDKTLASDDLIGALGVVITPVPAAGYGEVQLVVGGNQLKRNAKADQPLTVGTRVFVVAAPTETSVVVVETTAF